MTVIVRLTRGEDGRLKGLVERVRTGERTPVEGLEAIAGAIARMVAGEDDRSSERRTGSHELREPAVAAEASDLGPHRARSR
jgi:hypothetical protein